MNLRELSLADEVQALQGHTELAGEGWEYLLSYSNGMPWSDYLQLLKDESMGLKLREGRVAATFLIAESEGNLIGRTSIRHELNDFLFNFGGHIGYGVRPNFRRQGFATEILRQSLGYIHRIGITEVLITCHDNNLGSIKVIESQGGTLENVVNFKDDLMRRYWIKKQ